MARETNITYNIIYLLTFTKIKAYENFKTTRFDCTLAYGQ